MPVFAAVAFAWIYASDANRSVFVLLNALGPLTSDWFWANINVLGDALVAFALCLTLWRRRPDLLWAIAVVAVLGTLWVHGLKSFADVAGPPAVLGDEVHVIGPPYKTHSCPSGHATAAFAVGGVLALGLRSPAWKAAIFVVALLADLSRAVVGVHWPLDILAGMFGGWLCAAAGLWIADRTRRFGLHSAAQWTAAILLAVCAAALALGSGVEYPQAALLQRAIGLASLAAAAVGEAKPGGDGAGDTCPRGAERNADLATRRSGGELADRDEIGEGLIVEAFASLDEFRAQIADVGEGLWGG